MRRSPTASSLCALYLLFSGTRQYGSKSPSRFHAKVRSRSTFSSLILSSRDVSLLENSSTSLKNNTTHSCLGSPSILASMDRSVRNCSEGSGCMGASRATASASITRERIAYGNSNPFATVAPSTLTRVRLSTASGEHLSPTNIRAASRKHDRRSRNSTLHCSVAILKVY